jgi:hypothetical protein
VDRYVRVRGQEIAGVNEEETMQHTDGRVVEYTKGRRFMREAIRSTHHKPLMHGLVEVDVTRARSVIEEVEARLRPSAGSRWAASVRRRRTSTAESSPGTP